jgi:hypothetical protein
MTISAPNEGVKFAPDVGLLEGAAFHGSPLQDISKFRSNTGTALHEKSSEYGSAAPLR